MPTYKISFIGAGNVAFHLAQDLFNAGHTIVQVLSRNFPNAEILASLVKAQPINKAEKIEGTSDVYIMAVNDDAINLLIPQLPFKGKIVLHTSASVATVPVAGTGNHFGVLYPLQTFSKTVPVDISMVPFFIDGENDAVKTLAKNIAIALTEKVYEADEKKRLALHVAAVFANNFSNHILSLSEEIMQQEKLDFNLLKPLIEMTYEKIKEHHPSEMQTGPAARQDTETILKHREYLNNYPRLLNIYNTLTGSIINSKENK